MWDYPLILAYDFGGFVLSSKALVSSIELCSVGLSASGAQILIGERERTFALNMESYLEELSV